MKNALKINPGDTVAVALAPLEPGMAIQGMTLLQQIPAGHKFALTDMAAGTSVVKYGFPIGVASRDIPVGEWVHEHNLVTALSGCEKYLYRPELTSVEQMEDGRTFMGYLRPDGHAGIRNELWIIPTVGCVNGIAEHLATAIRSEGLPESIEAVVVYQHPYGCSQLGADHAATQKILANLVRHPNAGGVLVLGLGCENNTMASFQALVGPVEGDRVQFLVAQEVEDEVEEGLKILRRLRDAAAKNRRQALPLSMLNIGLKCGGSDAFSGLTANPLVGAVSDLLIARGGSAVLTEIPEVFGAEEILFARCRDEEVFQKAVSVVNDFKAYFMSHGEPVGENPSPGNKAGGITTLEEKSLGCVQKGGKAPLNDALRYGDSIRCSGLSLLEGPGNDIVAVTALAASGCQLVIFTTGRGTPLGGPVPVLKVATTSALAEHKKNWIDFNAGGLLEGESLDALAESLLNVVSETASGRLTCSERMNVRDFAIWKRGVTL